RWRANRGGHAAPRVAGNGTSQRPRPIPWPGPWCIRRGKPWQPRAEDRAPFRAQPGVRCRAAASPQSLAAKVFAEQALRIPGDVAATGVAPDEAPCGWIRRRRRSLLFEQPLQRALHGRALGELGMRAVLGELLL